MGILVIRVLDAMIVKNQVTGALERVVRPAAKGKATPVHAVKPASTARRHAHAGR